MFATIARAIFGNANDRSLKAYQRQVPRINALEPAMEALTDAALQAKTAEFRERLAGGATLDDLLPEAFAVVREAGKRTLGQRHFDVQLVGGMVLHDGKIAEMKTGEGKTLVATLPVYLNALAGKGVHVVTVNDYLARRDAEWMGQIYNFLGMSVGVVVHGQDDDTKRAQYGADITYGTNNEFGFDYLRDNMKYRLEDMVQRDFCFGIVDEVDSILIDEARTPLIISGPAEDSSDLYRQVNAVVVELVKDESTYEKDEKFKTVALTEPGSETVEDMLKAAGIITEGNLYDIFNVSVVHHVQQSLRAHTLFARDVDYIVRQDQVIIIDEFTGRMMQGRRYSEGLHQALEAKEGVTVQAENQTLASITFQNYFRLYPKLAGMTGTAMTEADEFAEIYKLDVVEIPTNVAVTRNDEDDEVYRTAAEKYEAVASLIAEARAKGQPVLVGTTSIEKSETISDLLKKKKVPHAVLNARFHEQEAEIVAQAGALGAVTIATNMAGRGTDIKLGGNLEMRLRKEASGIADEAARAAKEAQIKVETAGRSGAVALLPVAGRRSDADLRLRPDGRDAAAAGTEGRRGDRPSLDQQSAGEGAEEGRGTQLRYAQERVEIRRRDERAAQGSLCPAQGIHARGGRFRNRGGNAGGNPVQHGRAPGAGKGLPRAVATDGPGSGPHTGAEHAAAGRGLGPRGRHRRDSFAGADRTGGGPVDGGEGGQSGAGPDALHREVVTDPDDGCGVEGASLRAGPSAPGHRAAGLWSARSVERIQVRGVCPVQRHAR